MTEHGYPADPAYQVDPSFTGGDAAQAGYLTQSLVDLGEAGAEQVFVTLRDNLEGQYASEGLVHIDDAPGHATTRRESFYAVRRLATNWDQVMAWRREQRENERLAQMYEAVASRRGRQGEDRQGEVRAGACARARGPGRVRAGAAIGARPQALLRQGGARRAFVAGRRTALLWHTAYSRWQRERAARHRLAVEALQGPRDRRRDRCGVTRRYLGRRTGMRVVRSPGLRGVSACEGGW